MTTKPITSTLTWRPTDPAAGSYRPDMEIEILIYDGVLDDVVIGSYDVAPDGETPVWLDNTTGDPLPDPHFWTDKPFPGDSK